MVDVQLHLGDCIEIMTGMGDMSVDAVFADPPYGNMTDYGGYEDSKDNLLSLVPAFMEQALRIAPTVVVTPGNSNQYLYPPPTWTLAFVNPAGVGRSAWGFSCWQPIMVWGKDPYLATGRGGRPDIFIMKNSGDVDKHNGHPCPKPNNVMRWILDRTTPEGCVVLDPFMGSGTTGVACVQTGRNFIGAEMSEKYFEIAEKRIADAQLQIRAPI